MYFMSCLYYRPGGMGGIVETRLHNFLEIFYILKTVRQIFVGQTVQKLDNLCFGLFGTLFGPHELNTISDIAVNIVNNRKKILLSPQLLKTFPRACNWYILLVGRKQYKQKVKIQKKSVIQFLVEFVCFKQQWNMHKSDNKMKTCTKQC